MRTGLATALCLATIAGPDPARAEEDFTVKYAPIHFGGVHEFGMIHQGLLSQPIATFDNEWMDHFGTSFTAEAMVDDALELEVGLGGVFQFGKPEKSQEEYGGSQYKMFFLGPSRAKARYHFGGMDRKSGPAFTLGGGMFTYKYNPDAANLGEYLFRSGPYPTFIYTGGLTDINDNAAYLQGLHGSFKWGGFNMDLLLTTETNLPPLYDFSLGAVANYVIADGLLEIGAGIDFKRLLQVAHARTVPESLENAYFSRGGKTYVGYSPYYKSRADVLDRFASADTAAHHSLTASAEEEFRLRDSLLAIVDSLDPGNHAWVDAGGKVAGSQYFTPAGTLLMGRISMDLKKLFPSAGMSPSDCRLYAEAAVLGVKDYPIYYEKAFQRMPIMAGINLPTFGALDLLAVQLEYFNSPNLNNTFVLGDKNFPIPFQPEGGESLYSQRSYNDLAEKDNYAWSILLRKTLFGGLTLSGQAARDHLRTVNGDLFYASRQEGNEILYKDSSWYWMFQMAWSN